MTLTIDSDSANEAFARTVVAAYVTRLDPTLEELADIKTAVSEAVTNSIIHGYGGREGEITIVCRICGKQIEVTVRDEGIGIEDIQRRWNLCIRRNRNGNGPEWALLLWKHSWMSCK